MMADAGNTEPCKRWAAGCVLQMIDARSAVDTGAKQDWVLSTCGLVGRLSGRQVR